jgi:xanthine dehydrogenase accessory factor
MLDWTEMLAREVDDGTAAVLVTVVAARGSVPRPPGTRMIVTARAVHGTIGGGHLEFKAIAIARGLFGGGALALHRFPLGASLGQCCGGVAELLFEPVAPRAAWVASLVRAHAGGLACALVTPVRGHASDDRLVVTDTSVTGTLGSSTSDERGIDAARALLRERGRPGLMPIGEMGAACFVDVVRPTDLRIVLFGAGHVGRAIVAALASVNCRIVWVDSREDAFPATARQGVECVATDSPEAEVYAAPAGAYFLVMTHSHAQDEMLAERILARGDFAYFGLIGSVSKRRQFERRIAARGTPRERLAAMTCPIGIDGIDGKEPGTIAIAVVAQLLQVQCRLAAAAAIRGASCA